MKMKAEVGRSLWKVNKLSRTHRSTVRRTRQWRHEHEGPRTHSKLMRQWLVLFTLIVIKVNPRIYTILGLLYARRGRYMQELLESSKSFWNIGKEYEIYVYWYLYHDYVFDQFARLIYSIDKVVGLKHVFMTVQLIVLFPRFSLLFLCFPACHHCSIMTPILSSLFCRSVVLVMMAFLW